MLSVIEKFMAVHHLPDVTVVAEVGMISEASPEGHRGRRPVVYPGHEGPQRSLRGGQVAA